MLFCHLKNNSTLHLPGMKQLLALLLVFVFSIAITRAQTIINVTDYGIQPDSFEDAVPAVKKAIAACGGGEAVILNFPKGRYDFWWQSAEERNYFISNTSTEAECPSKLKKAGLLFENKSNITIEGNGSLFVFHGKMITFVFDHCDNMRLQNVSMDFERPSMSELSLTSVSDTLIVADIHPDSRYDILGNKLIFYGEGWRMQHDHAILVKPQQGILLYSSWKPFAQSVATPLAANKVAFRGDFSKNKFTPGDVLTIRDPIRDHVGAFINRSKNITLKNVNMHYMHGLGIISQFSENLHYDSVLVQPSHNRQIAAFADAMHFSGCKGNILIENCAYKGLHDDPVNVHGTHLQVTGIEPGKLTVRFMHGQTYGFEAFSAGDSVSFIHAASLQSFGLGKVKSAALVTEREMVLELETPPPALLQKGDVLENLTWTPTLTIKNCRFEGTNTRGLLVTTPRRVVIENNTFYRTGMHAILIADDASSWYESGAMRDVVIRGNTFEECGYNSGSVNAVINIAPENHELIKNFYVHRNIRIENNLFKVFNQPVLAAKSTQDLTFENNRIQKTDFALARNNNSPKPIFVLDACSKVTLRNNAFTGLDNMVIKLSNMNKKEINTNIKKAIFHP